MAAASTSDIFILAFGVVAAAIYLFRNSIFPPPAKPAHLPSIKDHVANGGGDPRDFVAKMKAGKKRLVIFYGSQTGTAEEYAIKLAKEAKSKFGLASLVCDPEEYDFENLDQVPEDCVAVFVVATYGEGEPTDNSVQLFQNLGDDSFAFTNGAHRLDGLKYIVFGLGNKTYEHYNAMARKADACLSAAGAHRIGPVGEGDDDKSMEEDYLAWKDDMWKAFATELGVEEGVGSETPDFAVTELDTHPPEKVYLGELSARALTKTRGIHDAKNPFAAPITAIRELFAVGGDRNCIHVEVSIEGSGMTYQHGDHLGVWPTNADVEVERLLLALGLAEKRDTVIGIESLDPALAKVPFPVPTTYGTVLRHYIDISAVAGRQILSVLAKHAPTAEAGERLRRLNTDKEEYAEVVGKGCLKLAEVLQFAAGDDFRARPTPQTVTAWPVPFDIIVSIIGRLTPRYYSISSSPKLHPGFVHLTAVVLKYESTGTAIPPRWVYGVGTNFLLNLKHATHDGLPTAPLITEPGAGTGEPASVTFPTYAIEGPRGAYRAERVYKVPVAVRRSTFRLPTNPKSPVLMVGPGTGVAPFRGFVQERVALAQRAREKHGEGALAEWGTMRLFYGCRRADEDFLYKDEWPVYSETLGDRFALEVACSRDGPKKVYVQDLIWTQRERIAEEILQLKGYIYICGDAKSMSRAVEDTLARILGEAKGGTAEVEGVAEIKQLKERSRLMLDVWS